METTRAIPENTRRGERIYIHRYIGGGAGKSSSDHYENITESRVTTTNVGARGITTRNTVLSRRYRAPDVTIYPPVTTREPLQSLATSTLYKYALRSESPENKRKLGARARGYRSMASLQDATIDDILSSFLFACSRINRFLFSHIIVLR